MLDAYFCVHKLLPLADACCRPAYPFPAIPATPRSAGYFFVVICKPLDCPAARHTFSVFVVAFDKVCLMSLLLCLFLFVLLLLFFNAAAESFVALLQIVCQSSSVGVMEALQRFLCGRRDRKSPAVAHKVSTAKNSDRILHEPNLLRSASR